MYVTVYNSFNSALPRERASEKFDIQEDKGPGGGEGVKMTPGRKRKTNKITPVRDETKRNETRRNNNGIAPTSTNK